MSTPSDVALLRASAASPLADLPVVGPVVGWVDAFLNDFGWPAAVNQALEFILLSAVCYFVGRWFLGRAVPWLTIFLVGPANSLVDGLRAIFLLPDFAVARTARLAKVRPPTLLYSYGTAVLDTADRLKAAVRVGLPSLAVVSRRPGGLTFVTLALAFVYWNTAYCTGQEGGRCESPTAQWVTSAKSLFDAEDDSADGNDSKGSKNEKGAKGDK